MRPQQPINEGQKESLKALLRKTRSRADFQRVLCVWLRACFAFSSEEVGMAVGLSSGTVKIIQARYFKKGESALLGTGRGGRRHENLSVEQEKELLESFLSQAQKGGVLVVTQVKEAYEKAVGHVVPKSTVYRMLSRHGWRKITPRPHHPKYDPERQEAFKKTS